MLCMKLTSPGDAELSPSEFVLVRFCAQCFAAASHHDPLFIIMLWKKTILIERSASGLPSVRQ
jgi:hypothetical protein